MGLQPLLRLHVPVGKVPGVTLEPRGLVGLLSRGLAVGLRAGDLARLQPGTGMKEGPTEAATAAARSREHGSLSGRVAHQEDRSGSRCKPRRRRILGG